MIAYLSGKLLEKQATAVILDVGGVGYEVTIPLSTFYELGEVGDAVELRIYTHVREDALQLFGFRTLRERELYLKLISVNGIGAKSGITMLSGMSADEIVTAIRTDNLARLTSIPGVGKKTAERLVIELRDKLDEFTTQVHTGIHRGGRQTIRTSGRRGFRRRAFGSRKFGLSAQRRRKSLKSSRQRRHGSFRPKITAKEFAAFGERLNF